MNTAPVDGDYINGVVDRDGEDEFVIWIDPTTCSGTQPRTARTDAPVDSCRRFYSSRPRRKIQFLADEVDGIPDGTHRAEMARPDGGFMAFAAFPRKMLGPTCATAPSPTETIQPGTSKR